jgi:hypothetical protein
MFGSSREIELATKISLEKLAFNNADPCVLLKDHDSYIRNMYADGKSPNYNNLGFIQESSNVSHSTKSKEVLENGNIFQIANNSAFLSFNAINSVCILEKKLATDNCRDKKLSDIESFVKNNCPFLIPILAKMGNPIADIDHVFINTLFPFVPYYIATSKKGGSDTRWSYLVELAWQYGYGYAHREIPFDLLICNPNKGLGTPKQKHFGSWTNMVNRRDVVGSFNDNTLLPRIYWLKDNFKDKNFDYENHGFYEISNINLYERISESYVNFESKLKNLVDKCKTDSNELSIVSLHRELDKWYCRSCNVDTDERDALGNFYSESGFDSHRVESPIDFGVVDNIIRNFK